MKFIKNLFGNKIHKLIALKNELKNYSDYHVMIYISY